MKQNWKKIGEWGKAEGLVQMMEDGICYFEQIGELEVLVGGGSKVDLVLGLNGSGKGKISIKYLGEGCAVRVILLGIGRGKDILEVEIETVGNKSFNRVTVLNKVVVFDEAKILIKGVMTAEEGTRGNDLYYAHHSLLMSERAEAVSFPGLDIKTDDIKAAHSASLGRIDEEMLFYLNCRGFSKNDAEKIVIEGFLMEYVDLIDDIELKKYLQEKILLELN